VSLDAEYEAVLGTRARIRAHEWEVADAEAARLAVSIALERRAPLGPGYPRPGRTGLRAPSGIQTLWPDELVARVGAGSSVAAVEEALAPHGLALGLEVPDPEGSTLGACFGAGRSGLAGPGGISLRDRCLGLDFVDGRARLLSAGARVVKNVAGYDYGRLHHGAGGSLGLILSITLRLIARPADRRALWWPCEREALPDRLGALRNDWGQDAVAELLVDRVAAVRFGLPGPGLVFRQFGPPEELHARSERTRAVDVSARWPVILSRSLVRPVPMTASTLSVRDPGEDWVADLGNGLLRTPQGPAPTSTPGADAVAIKRIFDPHGIFPALPGAETGS
jgi:hypothetical protein